MIEEEKEKVKSKKAKSLDASGADQRIAWLSSAPSTRSVSLNILPLNVEPGANLTILNSRRRQQKSSKEFVRLRGYSMIIST